MINSYEYEWLTGWKGTDGAAYNAVYEFLYEDGLIDRHGAKTPKGLKAVEEYEKTLLG